MSPSLVFVPGAWHSPEYWSKVTALLNDYKCICPELPTTTGSGAFKDDLEAVRAAILSAEGQVVVVVHSYGSIPGSSALKGLTGSRVIGIIAIATGFPMTGVNLLDGFGGKPPPFWKIEDGLAKLVVDCRELFYHDLPEAEGNEWVAKLRKQSVDAFYSGELVYAGWKEVPAWYLITTDDKTFPIEVQHKIAEDAQKEGKVTVREIDSSHSPMLSRPQETADFIKEAVRSFGG